MKKLILITLIFIYHTSRAQFLGTNNPNIEQYTDTTSNGWLLDCYNSGDTMSFRLRGEVDKGFTSISNYIAFNEQAQARGVVVKFMYCIDPAATAQTNFNNIQALINSGAYVPDVELFNEYYARQNCNFSFDCYKTKFIPNIKLIRAAYPQMRFFFSLAPNRGRTDQTNWNNAIKTYIQDTAAYNIAYHLYFNSSDCPILADSLIPQIMTSAYNSYLDTYYTTLRTQLISSTLKQDVESYLSLNFAGKKIAYTEVGITGGDPDRGSTSNIRNTFVYAEWLYYLLNNLNAYEIDIHSGISLTGIIQPTSKNDLVDAFKNKKRYEYYSLFLSKDKLTGKHSGTCYLPLDEDITFAGYTAEVTYLLVSSPLPYSSCGATAWYKNGSTKEYTNPLNLTSDYGNYYFGVKKVIYTAVPVTCYKKRWLFNSLPCKVSKTNCNCGEGIN